MTPAELDELKSRPGNSCAEVARRWVALRPHGRGLIGPCPVCSNDRQDRSATRFEVKGQGVNQGWVCAVCADGGDVIKLVQRVEGLDFLQAVDWLGGPRAVDAAAAEARERERAAKQAKRDAEAETYRQRERGALYDIWRRAAQPWGTPVEAYLAHRGLPAPPWPPGTARLRYVADMPYFHGQAIDEAGRRQPRIVHRGPAMVAAIVRREAGSAAGATGTQKAEFSGMHFTWLDLTQRSGKARVHDPDSGEELPAKKVRGSKAGGAIELIKVAPPAQPYRIVIGEGIETVLSVWHAMRECGIDIATTEFWSSVDLGNLGGRASAQVVHPALTTPAGRPRRVPGSDPDLNSPGIVLPESAAEVIALCDADSDQVLTQCAVARGAARFRAARADRVVKAAFAVEGLDFNDMLRAGT